MFQGQGYALSQNVSVTKNAAGEYAVTDNGTGKTYLIAHDHGLLRVFNAAGKPGERRPPHVNHRAGPAATVPDGDGLQRWPQPRHAARRVEDALLQQRHLVLHRLHQEVDGGQRLADPRPRQGTELPGAEGRDRAGDDDLRDDAGHGRRRRPDHRVGLGAKSTVGISVGIAAAINTISDTTQAFVADSTVSGTSVAIAATSAATIDAVTIGGVLDATLGKGEGFQGDAPGKAGQHHPGHGRVLRPGPRRGRYGHDVRHGREQGISVGTLDLSSILADAGGLALALSLGDERRTPAPWVSIGISVALNTISNTDEAFINHAPVYGPVGRRDEHLRRDHRRPDPRGRLDVHIDDGSRPGPGPHRHRAGSKNVIDDTVSAYITGKHPATGRGVQATGGDITVAADDSATINAQAFGVALGVGVDAGGSLGLGAPGAHFAFNSIGNTIAASILGSTVDAQALSVTANEGSTITALTVGDGGRDGDHQLRRFVLVPAAAPARSRRTPWPTWSRRTSRAVRRRPTPSGPRPATSPSTRPTRRRPPRPPTAAASASASRSAKGPRPRLPSAWSSPRT